jgi:hypothetical protein
LHTSGLCLSQNTGANSKGSVLKLGTHWNYCIATILAARPAGLRSFSDDIVFLHLTMAFLADECLAMSSVFRTPNWIWDKASLTPKWCWMILNEWCWIHIDIMNQDWILLNSLPTSSQWCAARSEWRGTVVVDCSWLVFLCRENALLRCLCSFHPPRSWTLATKLHLKIFLELKLQVEPVISRTSTLCILWVRLLSLLLWMNSFARTWHRSLPQWTWELCKDQALCSHMLMSPTGIIATCMSLGLTLSDSMFCHRKRDLFALHVISFCLQSLSVFLPVHPVALCACVPVGPCRTLSDWNFLWGGSTPIASAPASPLSACVFDACDSVTAPAKRTIRLQCLSGSRMDLEKTWKRKAKKTTNVEHRIAIYSFPTNAITLFIQHFDKRGRLLEDLVSNHLVEPDNVRTICT